MNEKPLQVYLDERERKMLEEKRKKFGCRSWAETIRRLIRNVNL